MRYRLLFLFIGILGASGILSGQVTGSFTDKRDNKTYKTVVIGRQTWMAENLAFKSKEGCYPYENNEANAKIYGYLYNWESATKVCPKGWHLPSKEEWMALTEYLGGDSLAHIKMKEPGNSHWINPDPTVNNSSGFTALPGGVFSSFSLRNEINFRYLGIYAYWWTSSSDTETGSLNAWFKMMGDYYKNEELDTSTKTRGSSVRCIKD